MARTKYHMVVLKADARSVIFAVVMLVTLVYLVLRAIWLPLIQDEANSFWWYARTGEFMPFRSHMDAGNHVISSFMGWIGNGLFGPQPWAVRIGSLLAFPLYATGCWMITQRMSDGVRWIAILSLLWCPYLHEYFALFRGYGIAMAFFVWALIHLVEYVDGSGVRPLWLSAACLCLATYSNLALLPMWVIIAGSLPVLDLVLRRRSSAMRSLLCAVVQIPFIAYVAAFALNLRALPGLAG